jgi:hypothetical protein
MKRDPGNLHLTTPRTPKFHRDPDGVPRETTSRFMKEHFIRTKPPLACQVFAIATACGDVFLSVSRHRVQSAQKPSEYV